MIETIIDNGNILFTPEELYCKGSGDGVLAKGFSSHLKNLRLSYGRPMFVTSCCRSAKYNKDIGGHPRSLHVYDDPAHPTGGTCAIDIKRPADGVLLHRLISLATGQGWSVGIADSFIHLDRRKDYTDFENVIYFY